MCVVDERFPLKCIKSNLFFTFPSGLLYDVVVAFQESSVCIKSSTSWKRLNFKDWYLTHVLRITNILISEGALLLREFY